MDDSHYDIYFARNITFKNQADDMLSNYECFMQC